MTSLISKIMTAYMLLVASVAPTSGGLETFRGGDEGGIGGIPFVGRPDPGTPLGDHVPYDASLVRIVDPGGGGSIPFVRVTVRDMQGHIVASRLTDELGVAVLITPPDGRFVLEVLEIGVADVPFEPGTAMLIVAGGG